MPYTIRTAPSDNIVDPRWARARGRARSVSESGSRLVTASELVLLDTLGRPSREGVTSSEMPVQNYRIQRDGSASNTLSVVPLTSAAFLARLIRFPARLVPAAVQSHRPRYRRQLAEVTSG